MVKAPPASSLGQAAHLVDVDDARGIALWWAPGGFTTAVDALDLREGGELVYTMTAAAPEAIQFMTAAGMPWHRVPQTLHTCAGAGHAGLPVAR